MKTKIIKTKEEARQYAIDYQNTFNEREMTYGELGEWGEIFEKLAEKFDLAEEFKENGII